MLQRISTKLVLAVLTAVVLPFLGFTVFLDSQMAGSTLGVVRQALKAMAADLAYEVDYRLEELRQDVALAAADPRILDAWEEWRDPQTEPQWGASQTLALAQNPRVRPGAGALARRDRTLAYDRLVRSRGEGVFELFLFVDAASGSLVFMSSRLAGGQPHAPATVEALFQRDFRGEAWLKSALAGELVLIDQHRSPYLPEPADGDVPKSHHLGLAAPVLDPASRQPVGALLALVSWQHFQRLIDRPVVKDYFRGLVEPGIEPSPYAWIWASDADTILAHENHALYGERVSGPAVGLLQMVEDARSADWGLYREYTYRDTQKNAAFKHCAPPEAGGLGWVVGVGIDNPDIYGAAEKLRGVLYPGAAVVLLVVLLWTMVIARRTTQPILALREHTRRVAGGDLAQRIEIDTGDELGLLATDFNRMTHDLAVQREQLIRAEKDAAWREMARQIAHDIKNPLTPIKLSVDLLQRAREEDSPEFERILDRTMELLRRQVENLREIAAEFHEFTGGRASRPEPFHVKSMLAELVDLHRAWADEGGVRVYLEGDLGPVCVDPGKLRRVLTNLVSNALQAMPGGGTLSIAVREFCGDEGGGRVEVALADTGVGLSEEVRAHLFEPFFTTRSEGTGLGLAIARRVLEEMEGEIELVPGEPRGTVARVVLPRDPRADQDPPASEGGAPA